MTSATAPGPNPVPAAAGGRPLMVVDGNSLLHRSFHALAASGARDSLGQPIWAIRGLLTQLVAAADRIGPARIVVGFDDPDASTRRERWPDYKAQRVDKLPTLVAQLARAAEVLTELGVQVVTPPGHEADDVPATATLAARALAGADDATPEQPGVLDALGWDASAQWRTRRQLPPLPERLQPTLF
ncbi:hypothetical protein [Naumannella huperziae]